MIGLGISFWQFVRAVVVIIVAPDPASRLDSATWSFDGGAYPSFDKVA